MQKSRLITTYNHDFWDKPVTGLAYLPGYYNVMKQQEKGKGKGKSTCIDFQTDVEPKPDGMDQLVESDKSLIFYTCNLCNMEFVISDELIEFRKKRHEEWHDGKQSNKHASQNKTWGKVIWKKLSGGENE